MGTDGEAGARFIKEGLGLVMVQAPDSAQYNSMPESIIESDNPDYVETPAAMARKLLKYVNSPVQWTERKETMSRRESTLMQKMFLLLRNRTGHDFSLYKPNTLIRRLERRMHMLQLANQEEYVAHMQQDPREVEALFKELLIGVTKFFRDYQAFEILSKRVLPDLIKRKQKNEPLRIWVAGCSTGEEAYSLGIVVRECLDQLKLYRHLKVQIFATDLDPVAIRKARAGTYLVNISNDVSGERLERWFTRKDNTYQVKQEIREMIVFAEHNLIRDASFTNLDLLCCRNVLIYFTPELQKKLLPVFHYTLQPNGVLFLGPSETIGGFEDMFVTIEGKWKIFKRREHSLALVRFIEFPSQMIPSSKLVPAKPEDGPSKSGQSRGLPEKIQRILLERHTPPALVINAKGDVVFIHGRTGKYLEPAPGQHNAGIYDMAREGLSVELRGAVLRATSQQEKIVVERIQVKTNGHYQLVTLTVEPLHTNEELAGLLLLTFLDQPTSKKSSPGRSKAAPTAEQAQVIDQLEKELDLTRQHLLQTVEQMQTTVEELKSANEELQSTNEELQSTNEESNTAKEEMQALNEELLTVNMEFRAKTDELTQLNNDMANLLNASDVATIFLGNQLQVKRFTPSATQIVPLVPADLGRPLTHFSHNLRYEHLIRDVREVLDKLSSKEIETETTNGQWYLLRIVPYRTLDNFIAGAVLTFLNITHLKELQARLEEALHYAENIMNSARDPLMVLDSQLNVLSVNQAFVDTFRIAPEQIQGLPLTRMGNGQWNAAPLREHLQSVLRQNEPFNHYLLDLPLPNIGLRRLKLHGRRLLEGQPNHHRLLLTFEDVTDTHK
jgi:two-component system CheB/CheR fusion protein